MNFADRLAAVVASAAARSCSASIPIPRAAPRGGRGAARRGGSGAERAARAVAAHCRALIEAAAPACVAVKPQLACFERLGAPGWAALGACRRAGRRAACW